MSSQLYDDARRLAAPMSRVWRGVFNSSHVDHADQKKPAKIILPDVNRYLVISGVLWSPRVTELEINLAEPAYGLPLEPTEPERLLKVAIAEWPRIGNGCLVVFDNQRQPWVTVWWPGPLPNGINPGGEDAEYTCDTSGNGLFYFAAPNLNAHGGMIVSTRKDGTYGVVFPDGSSDGFMAPNYVDPECD